MSRPRQVTDEQILEAAREAFLEYGPAVSTTVIAAAVGLSQGALFKRFPRKEDLMFAALAPPASLGDWAGDLRGGPDERPLEEQLREIISAIEAFFTEMIPRLSVMQSCGISHRDVFERYEVPPPVAAVRALAAWLRRAQVTGRLEEAVDAEDLAYCILGPIQMRAFVQLVAGHKFRVGSKSFKDGLVRLVLGALEPRAKARREKKS
jgi:AcrR family transcriptional regulator